jgi:hypothetical protein
VGFIYKKEKNEVGKCVWGKVKRDENEVGKCE